MQSRNLVDKDTVHDELRSLSEQWRGPFKKGDPYRDSPKELYADAFSALLNDPALVKSLAPTFHSLWFNYLSRKPEVKVLYDGIQNRIEQGAKAVYDKRLDRYLSMIRRGGTARIADLAAKAKHGSYSLAHALVDGLLDSKSEMYRKVRLARRRGASLNPDKNPLYWLEEMAYNSSEAGWYLDQFAREVLATTREAGVTDAEFGAFLGIRRAATERSKLHNPLGVQGEFAQDLQEHLLQKLGKDKAVAVEEAARKWWALRKEILDRIEASGAFSERVIKKAKSNPEYTKFYVTLHLKRESGSRSATGSIFRQIGTLQEIGNPVIETALADLALLRVAHRTQAASSIVEFMSAHFADEIKKATRGPGGLILPAGGRDKGTLYLLQDGKIQGYYVSQRIASWFEADPYKAGATYRAYNFVTRPLRALFVLLTRIHFGPSSTRERTP